MVDRADRAYHGNLVLSRRLKESIVIDQNKTITVVTFEDDDVRLAFEFEGQRLQRWMNHSDRFEPWPGVMVTISNIRDGKAYICVNAPGLHVLRSELVGTPERKSSVA